MYNIFQKENIYLLKNIFFVLSVYEHSETGRWIENKIELRRKTYGDRKEVRS